MIITILPIASITAIAGTTPDYTLYSIMVDGKYYREGRDELPDGVYVETTVDALRGSYSTVVYLTDFTGNSIGLNSNVGKFHQLTVDVSGSCTLYGSSVTSSGYWVTGAKEQWLSCIYSNKSGGTVRIVLEQESSLNLALANSDASVLPQRAVYCPGLVTITAMGNDYEKKGTFYSTQYSSNTASPEITTVYANNVYVEDVGNLTVNYTLSSWDGFKGFTAAPATFKGTGNISLKTSKTNMSYYMFTELIIDESFDAGLYITGASVIKDEAKLTVPEKNTQDKYICRHTGMWNCRYAIVSQYATGHKLITYSDLCNGFPYPATGVTLANEYTSKAYYAGIQWSRLGGGSSNVTGAASAGNSYIANVYYCPNPGYTFANMVSTYDDFSYIYKPGCTYAQNGRMKLQFNALPAASAAPAFTSALPSDTTLILHRSATPYKTFSVAANNAEAYKWYYVDENGEEKPLRDSRYFELSSDGKTLKLMYDPAPDVKGLTTIVCYATAFGKTPARTECKVDFEYALSMSSSFLTKTTIEDKFPELDFRYEPYGVSETMTGILTVKNNMGINVRDYYDDEKAFGIFCPKNALVVINIDKGAVLDIQKSSSYKSTSDCGIYAGGELRVEGDGILEIAIGANDGDTSGIYANGAVYFGGANADIYGGSYAIYSGAKTTVAAGSVALNGGKKVSNKTLELSGSYLAKDPAVYVGDTVNNATAAWNRTDALANFKSVSVSDGALGSITVSGVVTPKDGVKATIGFTVNENYLTAVSGSGSWYNSTDGKNMTATDTFTEGKEYMFSAEVKAQSGQFSDADTCVTVNGFNAERMNIPGDGTVLAIWRVKAIGADTVKSVTLTDVRQPVIGESYERVVFKQFTAIGGKANIKNSGFRYNNQWMQEGDIFEAGKQYEFWGYVDPEGKISFASPDKMTATVNGKTASAIALGASAGQIIVKYIFTPVYGVTFTGATKPVDHYPAQTDIAAINNANGLTVTGVSWHDDTAKKAVPEGTLFIAGHVYTLGLLVTGTVPDPLGIALINGEPATFTKVSASTYIFSAKFTASEHTHAYVYYKNDDTNHWGECSICAGKTGVQAHTYLQWVVTKEATQHEAGSRYRICSACHYKQTEEIPKLTPHTHSFGTEWKVNDTQHWHECTCAQKSEIANHSFAWHTDLAPTADTEGLQHEECTVCGYKKVAVGIPPLGGHTHSFTETVAGKDGIKRCPGCGALTCKRGDIDGNSAITSADARLALRQAVNLENFSGITLAAANIDSDPAISAADARLILRAAVMLENTALWQDIIFPA